MSIKNRGIGAGLFALSLLAACSSTENNDSRPTSAYAVAGNRQITVHWSVPNDTLSNVITGYTVHFDAPGQSVACSTTGGLHATSCVVPNLTNGTAYQFYVITNFSSGDMSKLSNYSDPVTPAGSALEPTNIHFLIGDTKIRLVWSPPLDSTDSGGSKLIGYSVSGGGSGCAPQVGDSCVVTQLTNGKAYVFVIEALYRNDDYTLSAPSDTAIPVSRFGYALPPTGVTAVPGNSQVTVSWTASSWNGGYPITQYIVTASVDPTNHCVTTGTTCTLTNLYNGESYAYTVAAVNAWGTGTASDSSATVIPATTPGAPTNPNAAAGNGLASVTWSPPTLNGGYPITQYTVKSSPGGFTCTSTQTTGISFGCTVSGLTNGTAYTFTVTAANRLGTGAASGPSPAITPTAAAATWTLRAPGTANYYLQGVVWTGTQFVAVGGSNNSATILTSPDGVTWTSRTSGSTHALNKVAWSGSLLTAVGGPGTILTSPDGITWTSRTSGTTRGLDDVAWAGHQFVAVGDSGLALTSPDGITWTAHAAGTTYSLYAVTWTGSQLAAVGVFAIFTSPDGITWTERSPGLNHVGQAIAWSGSRFMAVGNFSNADSTTGFTSTDGVTWSKVNTGGNSTLNTVLWDGSRFLYAGTYGVILASPDGVTTGTPIQPAGITNGWSGSAKSGTRTVLVGDGGAILTLP